MFTDYQQTLTYLYQNIPMFQRVGAAAYKADLKNTLALCEVLGNPQNRFKSIHVAGTNGKGSTSHMLASVLQSAGYKTGLYTSPHLREFTERIRVNGYEITQAYVVDFVNRIKATVDQIKPSFFEITVAMAFDYFASQQVDIAVIEVGLGGRLDSTNVIHPVVSVITNIGLDHQDMLGNTLEKIAAEKAGIIKHRVPVVISERQPGIDAVFVDKARAMESAICFASDEFSCTQDSFEVTKNGQLYLSGLSLPLKGNYQVKNIPGVLKTVEVLNQSGFVIRKEKLIEGLEATVAQTGLKGRWQILSEKPLIICDTAHNADGVQAVMAQIARQKFNRLFIVWGMVKDKNPDAVLRLLPKEASYYFCEAKIPRAMNVHVLSEWAGQMGLTGEVEPDVNRAIDKAKALAGADDFIFIGGSTFVVAEIHEL